MGELICKYGDLKLKGEIFCVELNEPILKDEGGMVHIQSKDKRVELSQIEFYRMVGLMNLALENLKIMKGDYIDE